MSQQNGNVEHSGVDLSSIDYDQYEKLYKEFHASPELSTLEVETSKRVITELKRISTKFEIKHSIGDYSKQPHAYAKNAPSNAPKPVGTGIVAILKNGEGQTVLLRADMDALPVEEKTGLPYASSKRMLDTYGVEQPVMHACGHDMHITSLLAAADYLVNNTSTWSGTILFTFQPAEERGLGSQAMVDGGMYDSKQHAVPIPDVVLGGHVMPMCAGVVGASKGPVMTASNSTKVILHGTGCHGSMPHLGVDPVVLGAHVVTRLQTIVSREIGPSNTACLTVGSFHAGSAENIISDRAELKVNMRSFNEEDRHTLVSGMRRIIDAECEASRAPKAAEYETISYLPLTYNNEEVTEKLQKSLAAHFGDKFNPKAPPSSASEDFSVLGTSVKKPCCFWFYGGSDPELWKKASDPNPWKMGKDQPINHSPYFAPVIQPTLQYATETMIVAALTWLGK